MDIQSATQKSDSSNTAAVIFDLDGLLFDSERAMAEQFFATAQKYGHTIREQFYIETIGIIGNDFNKALAIEIGDPQMATRIIDELYRTMEAIDCAVPPLKDGARDIVNALARRKIPMAIASSSPRSIIVRYLQETDLLKLFSCVVSAQEVPKGKPAPDVYIKAAGLLGIDPARCLAIEDSLPGAQAGLAAGMQIIVVPDMQPIDAAIAAKARLVASSLHQVLVWMNQEIGV